MEYFLSSPLKPALDCLRVSWDAEKRSRFVKAGKRSTARHTREHSNGKFLRLPLSTFTPRSLPPQGGFCTEKKILAGETFGFSTGHNYSNEATSSPPLGILGPFLFRVPEIMRMQIGEPSVCSLAVSTSVSDAKIVTISNANDLTVHIIQSSEMTPVSLLSSLNWSCKQPEVVSPDVVGSGPARVRLDALFRVSGFTGFLSRCLFWRLI